MLVLGLLIAGSAMAADRADSRMSPAAPGMEPAREIVHSSRLLANLSTSERVVVKGVCERRGIREISQILKRSEFEEMWAFLPRANGTGDCQWHEIGREEKSENDTAYLRVDMAYLDALMAENSEIHVYHFHPLKYFDCAAQADCRQGTTPGKKGSFDPRWVTDLVFSMPSPSDVHFMMDVTSRHFRRHDGRGTIRHRVVTPYGVVDYGLTDQGLAKFNAERHSRSEGLYIVWVVTSALDNDQVEQIAREHPHRIGEAIQELARTLNTEFLRVAYIPHPSRRNSRPMRSSN